MTTHIFEQRNDALDLLINKLFDLQKPHSFAELAERLDAAAPTFEKAASLLTSLEEEPFEQTLKGGDLFSEAET